MKSSLSGKYRELQKIFSKYTKVAIAFSGGVDSSLLLHVACATLGPSVVHAYHAQSELLPPLEAAGVTRAVQQYDCVFQPVAIKPLTWPEFVANGPDRCYHCKKRIYQTFLADPSFPLDGVLFDGTNHDDLGQDRPGLKAVVALNVQTPLADLGFTKNEIRLLSRELSLPTWNTYASSCLATRISHGEPITREKILLVSQCESVLQKKGFMGIRVGLSGETATISVLQNDLSKIGDNRVFSMIKSDFLSLGLHKVLINQQGRPDTIGGFSG